MRLAEGSGVHRYGHQFCFRVHFTHAVVGDPMFNIVLSDVCVWRYWILSYVTYLEVNGECELRSAENGTVQGGRFCAGIKEVGLEERVGRSFCGLFYLIT